MEALCQREGVAGQAARASSVVWPPASSPFKSHKILQVLNYQYRGENIKAHGWTQTDPKVHCDCPSTGAGLAGGTRKFNWVGTT